MADRKPLHLCLFADERSIHARRWVLGLRGLGHRVDLLTLKKDASTDIGGIFLGATSKLGYLTKIGALQKKVAELAPDIFHAHYASSYGFIGSFVNHRRKVLSVWGNDIIGYPQRSFLHKAILKRALATPHQITATTLFLERASLDFGWHLPPITVIPFGVDLKEFQYVTRSAGGVIRIGFAKGLFPRYGIDILIRAFSLLAHERDDLELLIAGKGTYEQKYKVLAAELGHRDRIRFLGHLPHDQMPHFFSTIDIFAMPSLSESFGVVALEASATGLPVVATRVGGIPEAVIDGTTGVLVERQNIEQLANAIAEFIRCPDLRMRMGLAGRRLVEDKYRWENNLIAMSDLYYRMMS